MQLLYINKVQDNAAAFQAKVMRIAASLNIEPDWLMVVMNFETGGTFSPSARNPSSGATGLIQFMPATAREMGTDTATLAAMSNIEQLDWVEKYYKMQIRRHGTIDNIAEAYLAVFYPAAISWDMTRVFPNAVYRQNSIFDLNKDGQITKQEIIERILQTVPATYAKNISQKKNFMNRSAFAIGIIMVIIGAYMATVIKQKGSIQLGVLLIVLGAYLAFTFRKISL